MGNNVTKNNKQLEADELSQTTDTPSVLDNPTHLSQLGNIAQRQIPSFLSDQDLLTLKLLDKACGGLFRPVLRKRQGTQALQHASRARAENVKKLCAMIEGDPSLLLEKFDVNASDNGDRITNMTIYEICLCRSPELADTIAPFFKNIDKNIVHGETERKKQYAKYKPAIKKLFTQPAYDWSDLLRKIKNASKDEVEALLKSPTLPEDHPHYHSELYQSMLKFRRDWAPCEFNGTDLQMHDVRKTKDEPAKEYSLLNSLKEAHGMPEIEWENLRRASRINGDKDEYDRVRLVRRQVIGFMERRLMGEDRCNVAQGLGYEFASVERSSCYSQFEFEDTHFPDTVSDKVLGIADLGGGFCINAYSGCIDGRTWESANSMRATFQKLFQTKESALQNARNHAPAISKTPHLDNSM